MQIKEPNWQEYQPSKHKAINAIMLDWLLEPGSLTQRLRDASSSFAVEVLKQEWDVPFAGEAKALNIQNDMNANIREVYLHCDAKPWVYAKTIIPKSTATGKEKALLELGNKPLGHFLFEAQNMHRSAFQIALIKPEHYQYQFVNTKNLETVCWARRSIFYLNEKPLLVCEYFTQDFVAVNLC